MSTSNRRLPQQERGTRRVAELLDSAAAVLAERGYEAATMTEIAERAGASIGALYQYFSSKEEIVRALRMKYASEMEQRWTALETATSELSVKQLAESLIDVMIDFMTEHPAYLPLLDASVSYRRDQNARLRLRQNIAKLLRNKKPSLSDEEAFRLANVSLQIVKSMKPLYAETKVVERPDLVAEFKIALSAYLEARLAP